MEVRSIAKKVRVSADKARLVMNLIRGKSVFEASAILKNLSNKSSRLIEKVLNSAVANAENNHKLDKNKLYVTKAYINEGPVMKRGMFDSRGHTGRKDRRTSHITVIVSERD
jgi:large subunit ribosomal protein L22